MHIEGGPDWLSTLLSTVEDCDADTSAIENELSQKKLPTKQAVSRWFKTNHDITLDAYMRMRRLALELGTNWMDCRGRERISPRTRFEHLIQIKAPNLNDSAADMTVLVNRILTPLGPMVVAANEASIILLEFADRRMLETQLVRVKRIYNCQFRVGINSIMKQLDLELKEYFASKRVRFDILVSDNGTEFQNSVWNKLKQIPSGTTSTYQTLAKQISKPKAVRAVGKANGDNRLTILIPCHRVVGSNGSLTGYGGGLDRKKWLLDHEKQMAQKAM